MIELKTIGGRVLYTAENAADVRAATVEAVRKGADLGGADLRGADLGGADLGGAYLRGAYLGGADLGGADLGGAYLRGAYLGGAYLRGAYLRGADLGGADLGGADLGGADLRGAYLGGAYLRGAYLRGAYDATSPLFLVRVDLWDVLDHAPAEVPGLRQALVDAHVDGSVYEGECACLVGTIAKVRGVGINDVGIPKNGRRPAEQWFIPIRKGDEPDEASLEPVKVDDLAAAREDPDDRAEGVYRATLAVRWIDAWTVSRTALVEALGEPA